MKTLANLIIFTGFACAFVGLWQIIVTVLWFALGGLLILAGTLMLIRKPAK